MDDLTAAVEMLLNISRNGIANGNSGEALGAIIQAITLSHPKGEHAIKDIFEAAKRKADEEQDRLLRDHTLSNLERAKQISRNLVQEDTILSENGMQTILKDAFEDGSSVVCTKCGSLVPTVRADAHSKYWCEFASEDQDMDDTDD